MEHTYTKTCCLSKIQLNWALCIFIWRIYTLLSTLRGGESSQHAGQAMAPLGYPWLQDQPSDMENRVSDLEEATETLSGSSPATLPMGQGEGCRSLCLNALVEGPMPARPYSILRNFRFCLLGLIPSRLDSGVRFGSETT